MSTVISDHTQAAMDRLLEQYKERPNIAAVITTLVNPLQEIEDQLEILSKDRWLDTAKGKQLDYLGEIIGEKRRSEDDAEFRRAIYSRILINNGGGTPEDIIAAIDLVYKTQRIDYSELYPASFQVFVQSIEALTGIKPLIRSVSPAGVGDIVVTHLNSDNPFTCSGCSTESFPLITVTDDSHYEVSLQEEGDNLSHSLEIAADTITLPENGQGFGEIIITESTLNTSDGYTYMLDDNTALTLIANLDDFKVEERGNFAGVIEHD